MRSHYMRHLIQDANAHTDQSATPKILRLLIQFWDDSNAIPADVQECMDSWQPFEARGFKRILFDDVSAKQFIADHFSDNHVAAFERCNHPAMRSDYFRLCFILIRGGFYVDADDVYQGGDYEHWFRDSTLKLQPLCYSTKTDSMVRPTDFTAEPSDTSGLIFYVNNNPLIAPSNHPVISLALERSTQILLAHSGDIRDIQSTTGPGNLTASLVRHVIESEHRSDARDFTLITDWNNASVSRWPLAYRNDERNWRVWVDRDE